MHRHSLSSLNDQPTIQVLSSTHDNSKQRLRSFHSNECDRIRGAETFNDKHLGRTLEFGEDMRTGNTSN